MALFQSLGGFWYVFVRREQVFADLFQGSDCAKAHITNKEVGMKRVIRDVSAAVVAVMLFVTIFIVFPAAVHARSVAPVDDAKFDVASTIKDNLKIYVGKDVVIHLSSGKSFQGNIKSIGDHLIHVEKLSGKDFYDALIRIEDITAIEAKFRDLK